ncbi:oligosaccharide repeat unit polymerase [Acinetobacter junii]|uniref:O-antigen polymerase n=1 Tax=Acinetobacter junii TaxID=40215 RepID=UPI0035F86468
MNPIFLILVALFSNFFGWFIVNKYCVSLQMACANHLFNEYYFSESIFELGIIYIFLFLIGMFFYRKQKKGNKIIFTSKMVFDRKYGYWILTIFILANIFYNLFSLNFGFDVSMRGAGQFDRDIGSAISRISLLVFPIFVLYRLSFNDKKSVFLTNIFLVTVLLSSLVSADRRILFYYLIAILLIKFYEGGSRIKFKNYVYIFLIILLLPLLYLRRFDGDFFELSKVVGFIFLQSSIGALGVSAILPQVKYLIVNNTGYLFGKSFIYYILMLFVPSFLIYFLGGNEFYFRSSLYFDDLFNDNPNMGYDFMMIADFYWNFGYLGYFIYAFLVFLIFYLSSNVRVRSSIKYQGVFIIIIVFFIAGQRSDFGLFMKSSLYSIVLYYFLYKILPKRKFIEGGK